MPFVHSPAVLRAFSFGLAGAVIGCGAPADGRRIDVSAAEIWPARGAEPTPLDREEWARACAIVGACAHADGSDSVGASAATVACTARPMASETAAIPMSALGDAPFPWDSAERWTFYAREVATKGGVCAAVLARATPRPAPIVCSEAGCEWFGGVVPPLVRCSGGVATLLTREGPLVRDCAAAFASCDPASATGCTDRPIHACRSTERARCDGDVRLGCSDDERITFADCSRHPGGICRETTSGAECVYPLGGECAPSDQGCEGNSIRLCIQGSTVRFDCVDLGLSPCEANDVGPHCVARP